MITDEQILTLVRGIVDDALPTDAQRAASKLAFSKAFTDAPRKSGEALVVEQVQAFIDAPDMTIYPSKAKSESTPAENVDRDEESDHAGDHDKLGA